MRGILSKATFQWLWRSLGAGRRGGRHQARFGMLSEVVYAGAQQVLRHDARERVRNACAREARNFRLGQDTTVASSTAADSLASGRCCCSMPFPDCGGACLWKGQFRCHHWRLWMLALGCTAANTAQRYARQSCLCQWCRDCVAGRPAAAAPPAAPPEAARRRRAQPTGRGPHIGARPAAHLALSAPPVHPGAGPMM